MLNGVAVEVGGLCFDSKWTLGLSFGKRTVPLSLLLSSPVGFDLVTMVRGRE